MHILYAKCNCNNLYGTEVVINLILSGVFLFFLKTIFTFSNLRLCKDLNVNFLLVLMKINDMDEHGTPPPKKNNLIKIDEGIIIINEIQLNILF